MSAIEWTDQTCAGPAPPQTAHDPTESTCPECSYDVREVWADLPSVPHYRVSDEGRIYGPRGMRKHQVTPDGHHYIIVYRRGAGAHGARRNIKIWVAAA